MVRFAEFGLSEVEDDWVELCIMPNATCLEENRSVEDEES